MERLESAISPLKKLLVGLLVSTRRKIRVHKYKLMKIPLVSLLFNDSLLSESQFCSGCCPVLVHSARIKNVNDLILIQILKGIYYSTQIHSTKEQMHCFDEKILSNLCQQIQAQFKRRTFHKRGGGGRQRNKKFRHEPCFNEIAMSPYIHLCFFLFQHSCAPYFLHKARKRTRSITYGTDRALR